MRHTLVPLTMVILAVLTAQAAEAQTAPVLPDAKKDLATAYVPAADVQRTAKKPQGITYDFTLAANLNVASNRAVVGQLNGNSVLFGASALASVSYLRERHEWLNTASLAETWSKTPAIGQFIKSNDLLNVQTLYNYFLREWTGPFLRANVQSSILKTDRVTATDVVYREAGNPANTRTTNKLKLSDSFQPFTLTESLGWFFQPVRSDVFNTYARVGLGGRHTFADGALAIKNDKDPLMNTFTVLSDVHQAGAELFAGVDGKELGGRILYNLGLSALFPILNNDDTSRSIAKLTRVSLQGAVGMGIFSWLSINYQLKVLRDVQLVDAIQVTNSLLLSLQYTKASPAPGDRKTEAELTRERIAALEARAESAEARAAAAEARAAGAQLAEPPAQPEPAAAPQPPPSQPIYPAQPAPGMPASP
ncbi:MAG: hypothetical protein JWN48_1680 [Myxococcaceae bacterium]|nr:hypothetical protein [Myxococcaceae bacterium]